MANNYKVKMKDIQNKYKFKIFCAGYEYDDTEIKSDIASLQNDVSGLQTSVSQKANITESGRYIDLELNTSTYVLTAKLKDKNNNLISTSTQIDLPLETMIVDAEYDSENKAIILTLQNGNTLSVPIGDLISGLVTQDDLDEVVDELDATKEELNQYKTIYNVLPKVEDEGEALTLEDTGNATLKMDLKGNTSQSGEPTPDAPIPVNVVSGDNTITSCGRNLAYTGWAEDFVSRINNNNVAKLETKDNKNCLRYTANAGYGDYDNKYLFKTNWKENTRYTIKCSILNDGSQIVNNYNMQIYYTDGTTAPIFLSNQQNAWISFSYTSAPNKTIKYITSAYYAGARYLDLDTFMVYEGTETLPYEPYQAQNYSVNLGVENLFDKDNAKHYSTDGSGNTTTTNYFNSTDYIPCNANDSFTISGVPRTQNDYNFKVVFFDSNKNYISRPIAQNGTTNVRSGFSTTAPTNAKYVMAQFYNTLEEGQFEKGTKANSYTPFGTTPIELCKIGNYQDYFYKDNGKWYKYSAIGKVVLDGSENFGSIAVQNSTGNSNMVYIFTTILDNVLSGNLGYCDKLTNSQTELVISTTSDKELFSVSTSWGGLRFHFKKNRLSAITNQAFKDWLASNNLIIYYLLKTPTTEEITNTTLISQLNAIQNAMSYAEQTNISQVNNDAPFIIDAQALKDLTNL